MSMLDVEKDWSKYLKNNENNCILITIDYFFQ